MKNNKYKHINAPVFWISYHFVFCPRYRRKIFLIPNLEERFKELVNIKCKEFEIEVLVIECKEDHAHLFLNCPPTLSASDIIQKLKFYTGQVLRKEFDKLSKMPNLWTRSYFVSTEESLSEETIIDYVETQKKRY